MSQPGTGKRAKRRLNRKRIFEMVEVGYAGDALSRGYDFANVLAVLVNLSAAVLDTFASVHAQYAALLDGVEAATVFFFTADYILRVWTADCLYPAARHPYRKYILSFTGLIDLLCFLPWYLPVFFPAGAVAFRMFRVVRIFRLFRVNAYYDNLNVITEVLAGKRQQLISSVFIITALMIGASLCMYSLEHEAQPEVFANAFSGVWWAASTLLTVGYGDIYPVTPLGQIFGIVIAFLGVGLVAIPTGIISAGFVEQYSRVKRLGELGTEEDLRFIRLRLGKGDSWSGRTVKELDLPRGMILAAVRRGEEVLAPRGDVRLREGDAVVLGAEPLGGERKVELQEIVLRSQHPWNGAAVRDLDISRQTFLVTVRRRGKALIPRGDLVLRKGDTVILYTEKRLADAETLDL